MDTTQKETAAPATKRLFLDGELIAQSQGVAIQTNPPELRGPVLCGERPWEAGWMHYACVLQDGDCVKMWYGAHPPSRDGKLGPEYFCYATSSDGIHWQRPELGLVEFDGSKDNNILQIQGDCVFIDPKAPALQQYKMLVNRSDPSEHCLCIAHSPDGIHWQLHEKSVFPFYPDTQNQVFYDPRLGKYVAYLRCWAPLRKVVRVEIENLLEPWEYDSTVETYKVWGDEYPWTLSHELPVAITYDELDPPDTDVYTPAVSVYPWARDAYFAFPSMYYHFSEPPEGRFSNDGLLEIQLAASRDGVRFERSDRRPYIPLGVKGGPGGGSLYMVPGLVRMGDEIYHYYLPYDHSHAEYLGFKELRGIGSVNLAVQRLDGFRSADADYTGGWLTTPPIACSGHRLELNIDCRATGHARLEVRNQQGLPIKGFALDDADLIRGNHVRHVVTWKGNSDLSSLAGKPVRLHFSVRNAKVYAFEFVT